MHKSGISRRCFIPARYKCPFHATDAISDNKPAKLAIFIAADANSDKPAKQAIFIATDANSDKRAKPATFTFISLIPIVFCVSTDLSCLSASVAEGARVTEGTSSAYWAHVPQSLPVSDQKAHHSYPLRKHSTSVRRVRDPQCGAHHAHYVTLGLPVDALVRACIVPV